MEVLINEKYFGGVMRIMNGIAFETKMEVRKTGVEFNFSDGVELIIITIPAKEFINFKFIKDLDITINSKLLFDVLKKFSGENFHLKLTNEQIFISISTDKKKREYSLRLIDNNEDRHAMIQQGKLLIKDKDIKFPTKLIIDSKEFVDMLDDLNLGCDKITIETLGKKLFVRESEKIKGTTSIEMPLFANIIESSSSYDSKKLNRIAPLLKNLLEKFEINFSKNSPLLISSSEGIELNYFLAPRVEN